jgi:sporulation-control protein
VFKNLMAKIGIGATKVNLILPKDTLMQGETITAKLMIEPGKTEQKIDHIDVKLILKSQYKKGDATHIVNKSVIDKTINESFVMTPGSTPREMTVELTVPRNIPISFGKTNYYFSTGLDVDSAVDPTDNDIVKIVPCPELACLLSAIEKLGFHHKYDSGESTEQKQEFEFKAEGFMHGKLNELEVAFNLGSDKVDVLMEIDKRSFGLKAMLDMNERHTGLSIPNSEIMSGGVERVAQILKEFIEQEFSKI